MARLSLALRVALPTSNGMPLARSSGKIPAMGESTAVSSSDVPSWMIDVVGVPLLRYLLNCDGPAIQLDLAGGSSLAGEQLQVVETLAAHRAALSEELDDAGVRDAVRHWLLQVGDDGRSTAARLRTLTCPEMISPAAGTDEIERAFAALAAAVYPAFLMPLETPSIPGMPELAVLLEEANSRVPDLIASLPVGRAFIAAVAADEVVGRVFRSTHAVLGPFAQAYLNTGHGGPVVNAVDLAVSGFDEPELDGGAGW